MSEKPEDMYNELGEASERLAHVVHELDSAKEAVRTRSGADEAARLKHAAAVAVADVARMLRAEGPAAAIAEEIVDDDLSALEESTRAVQQRACSPRGSASSAASLAGTTAPAVMPPSPRSPRVREGNAEKTL